MIDYIKSILPRIQQYSKQLNDEANFVDIPWGFLDDDGQKVTYIFRRSGELLVSKRGEVISGRWEYLSMMQSMLIEHNERKRMYNHGFLDEAVMILRKDGTDEIFPLVNTNLIPDLNLTEYLETKTEELNKPKLSQKSLDESGSIVFEKTLSDGIRKIIVIGRPGETSLSLALGKKVLDSKTEKSLEDGKFELEGGDYIIVKDGQIQKYFIKSEFWTGVVIVVFIIAFIILNFLLVR